jgi:hypothetical protein
MAYVHPSSTFTSLQKFYGDDGAAYVKAYVGSGIDGDTPVYVLPGDSGYFATTLAASTYGYVGVSNQGSIASGCVGSIQIEGYRTGVQCTAAGVSGTQGNALTWTGTTLFATSSSYIGAGGQIACLAETGLSGSTTANIFLTGQYTTPI